MHTLISSQSAYRSTKSATVQQFDTPPSPPSHPLAPYARKSRKYVRSHRHQLHELFQAFDLDPTILEETDAAVRDPGWSAGWKTKILETKKKAAEADAEIRTRWRIYSDRSDIDGGVGAAAVMYRDRRMVGSLGFHLGPSGEHTVYEAELVGMVLGMELLRREKDVTTATLSIDNQAAIQSTAKGEGKGPSGYVVRMVEEQYRAVKEEHEELDPEVRWVPGHTGVASG